MGNFMSRMSLLSGRHRIMGCRRFGALVMTVLEEGCKGTLDTRCGVAGRMEDV